MLGEENLAPASGDALAAIRQVILVPATGHAPAAAFLMTPDGPAPLSGATINGAPTANGYGLRALLPKAALRLSSATQFVLFNAAVNAASLRAGWHARYGFSGTASPFNAHHYARLSLAG